MDIKLKSFCTLAFTISVLSTAPFLQAEELVSAKEESLDQLIDSDGDSFPDVTEKLGGTDPFDISDFPGSKTLAEENALLATASFPAANCRSGFRQAGARLCISSTEQDAARYMDASYLCRAQRARVATYEDLTYLYVYSTLDATYNPKGKWIGNIVGDDQVLYGSVSITSDNDPGIWNFEATTNKGNSRTYWCAHDDIEG